MTTYTPQTIKTFYGPRLRKAVNTETQKIQSSFTNVDRTTDFGTHIFKVINVLIHILVDL